MPLDGLKLQARYLERVRAEAARPYPLPVAEWLEGLERTSVAFLANRLFGLPPRSQWESREHATASILHWLSTESDSPRDRERHDMLWRWMDAEVRRGAEVWPEEALEPLDGTVPVDIVDG